MFQAIQAHKSSLLTRIIASFMSFSFMMSLTLTPTPVFAQSTLNLPVPGAMVHPTASYQPALIRGITIHPEDALKMDFLVAPGDSDLTQEELKSEGHRLIRYFMASLTTPEEDMWVNLSPYEKNRIVPDKLGRTELGRDMLAQDYMLKQLTATMMYPEDELGAKFWNRVKDKAEAQFGTRDVPMNTFNKIWILPEKTVLYENGQTVFILESTLKVMLEEDYLALEQNQLKGNASIGDPLTGVSLDIVREVIIPEIQKEVNNGEIFAPLRQMYHSMILATWYKENLQDSLLGKVYANKNKTLGVDLADANTKQKIYDQYVQAFEKGVYSYIKEETNFATGETIPRKYFSGGLDVTDKEIEFTDRASLSQREELANAEMAVLSVGYQEVTDAAMKSTEIAVIGQRITRAPKGANTAEVNGKAGIRAGMNGALAGHSEARDNLGDTDEMVADQLAYAHELGLNDILFAFGEPESVREQSKQKRYVVNQIVKGLKELTPEQIAGTIFAYEPIWAIGTGKTATPQQAQAMAKIVRDAVRALLKERGAENADAIADSIRILYGGSVKPNTAADLISKEDVDGFLVGGASNQVEDAVAIIKAIEAQGPTNGRIPYFGGNNKTKVIANGFYSDVAEALIGVDASRVQVGFAPDLTLINEASNAFIQARNDKLEAVAERILNLDGGFLAADEGGPTTVSRLKSVGIEEADQTFEDRQNYRRIFLSDPARLKAAGVTAVIVHDEHFQYEDVNGNNLVEGLKAQGIGIMYKSDSGIDKTVNLPEDPTHEALREKLDEFGPEGLGADSTKYRITIPGAGAVSQENLDANLDTLAESAVITQQEYNMVPVLEPEVLINGDHDIAASYATTTGVIRTLFEKTAALGLYNPGAVLKTSMIISGKEGDMTPEQLAARATPEEVAYQTVKGLLETVPEDLHGVVFLSGGQSTEEGLENLNAILQTMNTRLTAIIDELLDEGRIDATKARRLKAGKFAWKDNVSYSYGRGLQGDALKAWAGSRDQQDVARSTETFFGVTGRTDQARHGVLDADQAQIDQEKLERVATRILTRDGGFLAADEGGPTTVSRLKSVGIEEVDQTFEDRQNYRRIFLSDAARLKKAGVTAVIVHDEHFEYEDVNGNNLVEGLKAQGIGIMYKSDSGIDKTVNLPEDPTHEALREKLDEFGPEGLGADSTKYRITIPGAGAVSQENLDANLDTLAESAVITQQEYNMVPILEPEVLINGEHDITTSYETTTNVIRTLFEKTAALGLYNPGAVLKTSMVISGKENTNRASASEVAYQTVKGLLETVPEDLHGVVFLSGGQSTEEGLENLNEILLAMQNRLGEIVAELLNEGRIDQEKADRLNAGQFAWKDNVSYSYGRGLQGDALKDWAGSRDQQDVARSTETFFGVTGRTDAARHGVLAVADSAQTAINGGIDFDPRMMEMQIERDGNGITLPISDQTLENLDIDGFVPVILQMAPVPNLPLLLGVAELDDPYDVSYLN